MASKVIVNTFGLFPAQADEKQTLELPLAIANFQCLGNQRGAF